MYGRRTGNSVAPFDYRSAALFTPNCSAAQQAHETLRASRRVLASQPDDEHIAITVPNRSRCGDRRRRAEPSAASTYDASSSTQRPWEVDGGSVRVAPEPTSMRGARRCRHRHRRRRRRHRQLQVDQHAARLQRGGAADRARVAHSWCRAGAPPLLLLALGFTDRMHRLAENERDAAIRLAAPADLESADVDFVELAPADHSEHGFESEGIRRRRDTSGGRGADSLRHHPRRWSRRAPRPVRPRVRARGTRRRRRGAARGGAADPPRRARLHRRSASAPDRAAAWAPVFSRDEAPGRRVRDPGAVHRARRARRAAGDARGGRGLAAGPDRARDVRVRVVRRRGALRHPARAGRHPPRRAHRRRRATARDRRARAAARSDSRTSTPSGAPRSSRASAFGDAPERVHRFRATNGIPPSHPRDLVYVSFGSEAPESRWFPSLYRDAIEALADFPVLLTIGDRRDPAELGPLPRRVRVERWVAQDEVMPRAAAVVGHGGSGSTLTALAAGVPLALVPLFVDGPENARRVAGAGAGDRGRRRDRARDRRPRTARRLELRRRRAPDRGRDPRAAAGHAQPCDVLRIDA